MTEKPRDGVGEYLVIETLKLDTTHRGRGRDYWIASGKMHGLTMHLHIWDEDFIKFEAAGYNGLFHNRNPKKDLAITVITDWRDGFYRVGSVEPMMPVSVPTVSAPVETAIRSNEERARQFMADVHTFGYERMLKDETAKMVLFDATEGMLSVAWKKLPNGQYQRQEGEQTVFYAAKPEAVAS